MFTPLIEESSWCVFLSYWVVSLLCPLHSYFWKILWRWIVNALNIQKFQTLFSLISLNIVKILIFRSLNHQILLKIANSRDPDQTAPEGAVWSGSALFVLSFLSGNYSLKFLYIDSIHVDAVVNSLVFQHLIYKPIYRAWWSKCGGKILLWSMSGCAWQYEIIFVATKISITNILNKKNAERSGSVGRVLDWGSKGCWTEPHHQGSHCVVSLTKTLILVQPRKTYPKMTEKLLIGM